MNQNTRVTYDSDIRRATFHDYGAELVVKDIDYPQVQEIRTYLDIVMHQTKRRTEEDLMRRIYIALENLSL